MIKKNMISLSVSLAMLGVAGTANAASWTAGDWELGLGGNINAFMISTQCDAGDLQSGGTTFAGLACAGSVDQNGNPTDSQSIQNGLLPASLNFSAKTQEEGWDIGANINVYYGIDSFTGAGGADALKFSTVDARQIYMTAAKNGIGEFKLGRDFGLFAFDAIINDMSLIGTGPSFVASDPGHTTLGGLGYGYVYTDRLAQMNYSRNFGDLKGTIGIFQPFDGNGASSSGDLGYHGKLSYSKGPLTVSSSFLSQGVNSDAGTSEDIKGIDLFAKYDIGKLGLAGYAYEAEGMTSLAIGGLVLPGFDIATGAPEETTGYMLQATYKATPKLKLGVNLGHSEQDVVTNVENDKVTLGAYYGLTKSLTVLGEFSKNEGKLTAGTDDSSNFNVGAILFF